MFKNSFEVTQEVTVEVTIDDVLENIDTDELFNALLEQGCDLSDTISNMDFSEVVDNFQHYEIVSWAASNLDTDEVLDAFKDADVEGFASWLEKNDDILPTKGDAEEAPKPEPTPLKHPFVSMIEGRVLVDGEDAGTYKVFGGVIAVDAFNVQFMANTVDNAAKILNAVTFASVNLSEV